MSELSLSDRVRATLRRLIEEYGPDLIRDRARLAGLLRDECGEAKREINLVLDALDEHVVDTLRSPSQVLLLVTIPSCAKRLHEARGTEASAALWAVQTWAHALGLADGAERPGDQAAANEMREQKAPHRVPAPPPAETVVQVVARNFASLGAAKNRPRLALLFAAVLAVGYLGWPSGPGSPSPPEPAPSPPQPAPLPAPQPTPSPRPAPAPPAAGSQVDRRLLGTWRTYLTNEHGRWTFEFTPQPDGSYRTRIRGRFPVPDDIGRIRALDGKWDARRGNGSVEDGTYTFINDNKVVFKGYVEPVTWERVR